MKNVLKKYFCGSAAAALCWAFLAACSEDVQHHFPDDRLWESAHFRYHSRESDAGTCEAVLLQLERHFEGMQAYLGFTWPEGRKVDYYKFLDLADYLDNSECPENSGGCSNESTIRSPFRLEEHELIHAYLAPLGLPPEFFVEGVASALACSLPEPPPLEPRRWQDLVAISPGDQEYDEYFYGGWFVSDLLHRYGPEPFLALYQRLDGQSASVEQISSAFASVYGITLDSAWNTSSASGYRTRCVNFWKCSGPDLPLDGSPQSVMHACDGSDNTRTLQLDTATGVLLNLEGMYIFGPTSCDEELPYAVSGDLVGGITESSIFPLSAGKYFIEAMSNEEATFGVRTLSGNAFSQDCAALETIALNLDDFPRRVFKLTIPNDGPAWFVKLNRQIIWPGAVSIQVDQCHGCGESLVCTPIGSTGDTTPDSDGTVTLRLTPTAPGPGFVTSRFLL